MDGLVLGGGGPIANTMELFFLFSWIWPGGFMP